MPSSSFCSHRISIVTGHYGTGKTEFAVNLALAMAAGDPVEREYRTEGIKIAAE